MVFGVGPAGTGKTYLAVAMAVAAMNAKKVSRIVLVRPAVEAGERLGFLPGTLQEKVDPYLRPLYDALYDLLDPEKVDKMLEKNVIEVAPLAFMRGRTLNDAFIIMDEAQNTTDRADEDVPDAHGQQLEGGDHGRHYADRSCPIRASRACWMRSTCWMAWRAFASATSRMGTWCGMRWCSGSCAPTRRPSRSSRNCR